MTDIDEAVKRLTETVAGTINFCTVQPDDIRTVLAELERLRLVFDAARVVNSHRIRKAQADAHVHGNNLYRDYMSDIDRALDEAFQRAHEATLPDTSHLLAEAPHQ